MLYVSILAGIISCILTYTGFWAVPMAVGVVLLAVPAVALLASIALAVIVAAACR